MLTKLFYCAIALDISYWKVKMDWTSSSNSSTHENISPVCQQGQNQQNTNSEISSKGKHP